MATRTATRRALRKDAHLEAAAAVERFLDALGLPPDARLHPDLADTPRRVAETWLEDLADGYRHDPAEILSESMPAGGRDLVAVTGIDFHAVCPHHLLPYRGVAHVGYVPGGRVVGFGQLARIVDCFAHRLVIEETLARQIAEALVRHLGARGAACALDAEQLCLTVRGVRRRDTRAHALCFVGTMERDSMLQERFLALAGRAAPDPRRTARRGSARATAVGPCRPRRAQGAGR